ncbi:coiled-coil domain-containing protein 138-like [Littorina saxatilis]|uniref:Coiled-coil domain-containing protein 138 n=1 Tax=Littorina saxatilis TaxID=31220 RepID=A0AAN9B2D6_9CAEN
MDNSGESDIGIGGGVTPIMGSPAAGYCGQVLDSDSDTEFSPVLRRERALRKQTEKKKRRGNVEVSFNIAETSSSKPLSQDYLNSIYEELQAISEKLKGENHLLYEREQKLKERERMLSISQSNLQTITDHQARQQVAAVQQKYLNEIAHLEQALKEKNKENKRLKENFETMKQANDMFKKEAGVLQAHNDKLSKQNSSLQARLSNLQKKQEFEQRQREGEVNTQQLELAPKATKGSKESKELEEKQSKQLKSKGTRSPVYDIMSVLLEWVCEAHLRQSMTEQPTHPSERFCATDFLQDKVLRLLPSFVEILRESQLSNVKRSLPCLQFVYWSLLLMEQGTSQQKASLSSTLRRLGEEIYRPRWLRVMEEGVSSVSLVLSSEAGDSAGDAPRDALFLRSHNQHVRLLSCVIILKTLSQADVLAHAFDVLKVELKSEVAKELFLYYQATPVITHYLKPTNKAFMSTAVDILLQMSTDSPFQAAFLESCSNESFFRTAAMVIRTPLSDPRIMERLSIILQKLSKIRSNKKFFEVYTIVTIIQELLRSCGNENAFLALNLKSILFNLNSTV